MRFPGLSYGKYEFKILAINEDGTASKLPASLKFSIKRPWWTTWWIRTFVVLLATGVIWFYFFLRFRNKQRQEKIKQEFQQKLDELSMQALQTQMNPHFIFNSLNAIQHFLTINDKENALMYLAKFSRLIRLVFTLSTKKEFLLKRKSNF